MTFKTNLFRAIALAEQVSCMGYEIDGIDNESGQYRLACGDDDIAIVADQEIEIDDGYAMVQAECLLHDECEQRTIQMSFFMSRPFEASDIPEGV